MSDIKVTGSDSTIIEIKVPGSEVATEVASRIVRRHLPQMLGKFLQNNRKYRKVDSSLGARGVFPDIHRKVGILKDRIWDGSEVVGEDTVTVIDDLIGHLFLVRDMIIEERAADRLGIKSLPRRDGPDYPQGEGEDEDEDEDEDPPNPDFWCPRSGNPTNAGPLPQHERHGSRAKTWDEGSARYFCGGVQGEVIRPRIMVDRPQG